jgi:hypothetical protein
MAHKYPLLDLLSDGLVGDPLDQRLLIGRPRLKLGLLLSLDKVVTFGHTLYLASFVHQQTLIQWVADQTVRKKVQQRVLMRHQWVLRR